MREPIIEARRLTKHFGGSAGLLGKAPAVHAVDEVDLAVRRGETFAIVGESGCGKSTLARLLLRLILPTSGEVAFEGRTLTSIAAGDLRRLRCAMQIIFQDPFASLNPRLSVAAIVGEPLWLHGLVPARERAGRVAELLRMVGLEPAHAGRYPHEFSGGQRQRIGIARALASGPKLLVGDEPVSALDVSIQAQIINLLEDLKAELGLTLIVVSHDLAVVRHMSDRVAVMYLGRDRRGGAGRGPLRARLAPLHPGASRRRPGAQPRRAPRAPGARGRPAEPGRPASGLPLPHPLPARARHLPRAASGQRGGGRQPARRLPSLARDRQCRGGGPPATRTRARSCGGGWRLYRAHAVA